jgi:hypothetical protein
MDSNLSFDLTTDEAAQNANSLLVRLGWSLPIALFLGPVGLAAVAISALAGTASTTILDKQKQAAIELIRAGKENGVKRMTIVLDETVGLDLGTSFEGIPIKCRIGVSGTATIEVTYA